MMEMEYSQILMEVQDRCQTLCESFSTEANFNEGSINEKPEGVMDTAILDQLEGFEKDILMDIPRTFQCTSFYHYKANLRKLYRVLYSYAIKDMDVGYIQGMNYIVGSLLFHADEPMAYNILKYLMDE